MSSNVFANTSNSFSAAAAAEISAPVKAGRRAPKFPWLDLPFVLPLLAALLLIIGFGIVAAPLVVKDLPLLLGQNSAVPAHATP